MLWASSVILLTLLSVIQNSQQKSAIYDFKTIFHTPDTRYDDHEILERANFGTEEEVTDAKSDGTKAVANAQVLLHFNEKPVAHSCSNGYQIYYDPRTHYMMMPPPPHPPMLPPPPHQPPQPPIQPQPNVQQTYPYYMRPPSYGHYQAGYHSYLFPYPPYYPHQPPVTPQSTATPSPNPPCISEATVPPTVTQTPVTAAPEPTTMPKIVCPFTKGPIIQQPPNLRASETLITTVNYPSSTTTAISTEITDVPETTDIVSTAMPTTTEFFETDAPTDNPTTRVIEIKTTEIVTETTNIPTTESGVEDEPTTTEIGTQPQRLKQLNLNLFLRNKSTTTFHRRLLQRLTTEIETTESEFVSTEISTTPDDILIATEEPTTTETSITTETVTTPETTTTAETTSTTTELPIATTELLPSDPFDTTTTTAKTETSTEAVINSFQECTIITDLANAPVNMTKFIGKTGVFLDKNWKCYIYKPCEMQAKNETETTTITTVTTVEPTTKDPNYSIEVYNCPHENPDDKDALNVYITSNKGEDVISTDLIDKLTEFFQEEVNGSNFNLFVSEDFLNLNNTEKPRAIIDENVSAPNIYFYKGDEKKTLEELEQEGVQEISDADIEKITELVENLEPKKKSCKDIVVHKISRRSGPCEICEELKRKGKSDEEIFRAILEACKSKIVASAPSKPETTKKATQQPEITPKPKPKPFPTYGGCLTCNGNPDGFTADVDDLNVYKSPAPRYYEMLMPPPQQTPIEYYYQPQPQQPNIYDMLSPSNGYYFAPSPRKQLNYPQFSQLSGNYPNGRACPNCAPYRGELNF
ncbi:PREDICTED: eukaryotic translation initiation factor 4 gamma-like [Nicrophorus vespilloides]|uniref:Eukaryotic translation initiation factor 4 gamma-like n=1 Tax=Nicrophorus vespilloides TaxID=110193 RepID=A0ABM1NE27_NICVS|nr:PREDICTED: eukaryotic translation initiation factor 4 gamma-like [Nicrophorus vespilloides]